MGALQRSSYTIPLPDNATVTKDGVVKWITKGKEKTGKLSNNGRVFCWSEFWIASYTDENGKLKKVSTKTKNKEAANRILVKLENDVLQVRAGVLTRKDIDVSNARETPILEHLEDFLMHKKAEGVKPRQIKDDRSMLPRMFHESGVVYLHDITRQTIEKWIVQSKEIHDRGPRTINSYMDRLKTFCNWLVEEDRLHVNPTAKIKDQIESVDIRKQRRALTTEEIQKLLAAARKRKRRSSGTLTGEEVEMIYRTMLGTGLRSTETASLLVWQIDTARRKINLKPSETKNKKGGFQPITQDLANRLAVWIQGKEPSEKVFHHNVDSLMSSFRRDCRSAGIALKSEDGRSIDVHSLRRTFGTMLARAGVPLTTTQRLMRHSTPELTARLYIDVEPIDMYDAVDRLNPEASPR